MSARGYSYAHVRTGTRSANLCERMVMSVAEPLTWVLVNYTRISPNSITLAGGAFGLLGSFLFFSGRQAGAGAAYAISYILDCSDGAVARLTGRVSDRGASLDLVSDRTVLLVAALTRTAFLLRHGQPFEAWLCMAYLASHYAVDLRWLMELRTRTSEPQQLPALERALRAHLSAAEPAAPPAKPPRPGIGYHVANLMPSIWVCNIAFVVGGCYLVRGQAALYITAALLLHWYPLAMLGKRARHPARKRLR